jgi:hypothetical protein
MNSVNPNSKMDMPVRIVRVRMLSGLAHITRDSGINIYSEKGKRNISGRKPRKRGGVTMYRGSVSSIPGALGNATVILLNV